MNVALLLAGPVEDRPDAAALIEGAGARARLTTFAQLDRMARRIAAELHRDRVGPGSHVLFYAPPSPALYAALVATWRVGAVAMFVEPSAGREKLDAACALCPPAALIASPKAHLLRLTSRAVRAIPHKYSTGIPVPGAPGLGDGRGPLPNDTIAVVDGQAPALLTFTSGSTGRPKGAVRTHAILRAQLEALSRAVAAPGGEREMVTLPVVVLLNLANGVETVLADADLRRPGAIDPTPVLEQIRTLGVNRITASPAFLERLADAPEAPVALRALRTVVTGGGPVFPDLVDRLHRLAPDANIVSVYGSTEAEPIAHITRTQVSDADRRAMEHGGGLLAGAPDPVVQLRIVRAIPGVPLAIKQTPELEAITLGSGAVGEIMVAGPHVVAGYVNGIGENETKVHVDGTVWHRTGDLGYQDVAGRLWLLGRATATATAALGPSPGASESEDAGAFYPFAIECAARLSLGVRHVAALLHDGQRLLVLQHGDGAPGSADDVRRVLAWAKLEAIRVIARIPVDRRHNSKVDYPALAALLRR